MALDPRQLASFIAACGADPNHCPVLAEWLYDQEATLPEVLLAYAGEPPDYQGGIPHAALALWLQGTARHTGEGHEAAEAVAGLGPDLGLYERLYLGHPRLRVNDFMRRGMLAMPREETSVNWEAEDRYERKIALQVDGEVRPVVLRDLKRRTLALFPGVECVRGHGEPMRPGVALVSNGWLRERGFRPDRRDALRLRDEADGGVNYLVTTQTLAAPDLIPPEPGEGRLGGESQRFPMWWERSRAPREDTHDLVEQAQDLRDWIDSGNAGSPPF